MQQFRNARLDREYEDSRLLGFSKEAEIINGRSAMFFLGVGLLTEAFSGESMPSQVMTFLETFGIVEL